MTAAAAPKQFESVCMTAMDEVSLASENRTKSEAVFRTTSHVDSIFEATLNKTELLERVRNLEPGAYRAFVIGIESPDIVGKVPHSVRSSFLSQLSAKKTSFLEWGNMRPIYSKSRCNMGPFTTPLANLKRVLTSLIRLLNRGKQASDPVQQSGDVATVKCDKNAAHDEVPLIDDDEYARILEDLEIMAEERIRTLMKNSTRELPSDLSSLQSTHSLSLLGDQPSCCCTQKERH